MVQFLSWCFLKENLQAGIQENAFRSVELGLQVNCPGRDITRKKM
jgi:hypothetical protein